MTIVGGWYNDNIVETGTMRYRSSSTLNSSGSLYRELILTSIDASFLPTINNKQDQETKKRTKVKFKQYMSKVQGKDQLYVYTYIHRALCL